MSELKSSYKILTEHNIIIEFHSGVLKMTDYRDFKLLLFKDPLYSQTQNYFVNFKNVDFRVTPEEIKEYISFLNQNPKIQGVKKLALLTNTPKQAVSTTIYKLNQHDKNQSVEIFSTTEAAIKWLNIEITEFEMSNLLLKLSI